jgi:hypothetical protein
MPAMDDWTPATLILAGSLPFVIVIIIKAQPPSSRKRGSPISTIMMDVFGITKRIAYE